MLSEEEQAVISLRHGLNSDELSLHEIAEVLSLPISNIRSRYYRALNKLDIRAAKKLGYE
jgi:DNA-directed RNA polymerase specialized sigma24 family protein